MFDQPAEFDSLMLAAVLYRPEDDADTLLAEFATGLARSGVAVGGIVQRNLRAPDGSKCGMQAIDLMTGRAITLNQSLGSGASACQLDPAGLAEASQAIARAVEAEAALVVINKFSKQEAEGRGHRSEFANAVAAGLPVLTAVPQKCLGAWIEFTAGRAAMLVCDRPSLEEWWSDVCNRAGTARGETLTIGPDATGAMLGKPV